MPKPRNTDQLLNGAPEVTPAPPAPPVKTFAELKAESERYALEQQLAQLQAENERLRLRQGGKLSLKISEKGALSVYGMGRFPVTLYREQWEKLIALGPQITDFIRENSDRLKTKE